MKKLIESLCLYCQGDFSDRMLTSFFVTHEDKAVRKISEAQREVLKNKAQDLHLNLILKTSIITKH